MLHDRQARGLGPFTARTVAGQRDGRGLLERVVAASGLPQDAPGAPWPSCVSAAHLVVRRAGRLGGAGCVRSRASVRSSWVLLLAVRLMDYLINERGCALGSGPARLGQAPALAGAQLPSGDADTDPGGPGIGSLGRKASATMCCFNMKQANEIM